VVGPDDNLQKGPHEMKGYIMNEGMENLKQIEELEERSMSPLMRIADAIEEILRLVKKDMEPKK
jgi:hypothetical protein